MHRIDGKPLVLGPRAAALLDMPGEGQSDGAG